MKELYRMVYSSVQRIGKITLGLDENGLVCDIFIDDQYKITANKLVILLDNLLFIRDNINDAYMIDALTGSMQFLHHNSDGKFAILRYLVDKLIISTGRINQGSIVYVVELPDKLCFHTERFISIDDISDTDVRILYKEGDSVYNKIISGII